MYLQGRPSLARTPAIATATVLTQRVSSRSSTVRVERASVSYERVSPGRSSDWSWADCGLPALLRVIAAVWSALKLLLDRQLVDD